MLEAPRSDEVRDLFRLADQSAVGMLRFDSDLTVIDANEAAHRSLQRPASGLVGRSVLEAFVDHRLEELVLAASMGESGTYEMRRADDQVLLVRAHPAAAGGAWVSVQTVTELRNLQRIRSEFVDNLSHELRTPLANIRLLTEMLLRDIETANVPDRMRERVVTIDVESGHVAQMIDELLDLSRMEQGGSEIRQDEIGLQPLVDAAVARLQTFAERQGVTVEHELPRALRPIRGDEERLSTLLLNLLHNAIKFSPDGGQVTVTADELDATVVISVADEGEGIPEADRERVFERFYKVDRARHRGQGGTGLGLAIARDIAEAHAGRIWLDSREGPGTTISFSLPIA